VLVATKPVDFRRGADSLAALAKEALKQDPYSGVVLVFRAKRADRIKIVSWDGTGLVMLWKAMVRIPVIVGAHSRRWWAPIPRDRGRSGA
jgi:transposase